MYYLFQKLKGNYNKIIKLFGFMEKLFKNLKLFLEKKIFSMLMLDLKLKLGILNI